MESLIGTYLGPYEIISRLGSGGMGEVYQAIDKRLDRKVAIKVLPARFVKDFKALTRFKREMKALAALSHINILTIYEFDREKDVYFAVTELLKGDTLRSYINCCPLPWEKALDIAIQIAEGLAAAHSKEIIHRDLKPENIFITSEGCVKILDFGLAKSETHILGNPNSRITKNFLLSSIIEHSLATKLNSLPIKNLATKDTGVRDTDPSPTQNDIVTQEGKNPFLVLQDKSTESTLEMYKEISQEYPEIMETFALDKAMIATEPGVVVGTLPYMSPEQFEEKPIDIRSDVFSFGSLFYEMLTGIRPFYSPSASETIKAILTQSMPKINKAIPKELEEIISHCLQKDKAARFQSGYELASALKNVANNIKNERNIVSKKTKNNSRKKLMDSIAVLPFFNKSSESDPQLEYFSLMMSENLTYGLSKLSKLRVMAHSTVSRYKNQSVDPQEVGATLKVSSVLLGSIFKINNTLKIWVELVNTFDGSQLWSEHYEMPLKNISLIEEEITSQIINNVESKLKITDKKPLKNNNASKSYEYLTSLYLDAQKKDVVERIN